MKPSKDILNRVIVPWDRVEITQEWRPKCPVCGTPLIWTGDTYLFPMGDTYYCPECRGKFIEVPAKTYKRMRKLTPEPEPEIDFTCLLKLDPTWPGCYSPPHMASRLE